MNKITVDLSGIKDPKDPYYEIEVRVDKNTKVVFPKAFCHGQYSKEYYDDRAYDSHGVLLFRRYNNIIKSISGDFEFYPQVVDGVVYKEIREVRNDSLCD